jgi:hypothetical protein
MNSDELIELLGPRLKARADIPPHFSAMTTRVRLSRESSIIRSIHASLSRGAADWAATLDEKGNVIFWKRCLSRRESADQQCAGVVSAQ